MAAAAILKNLKILISLGSGAPKSKHRGVSRPRRRGGGRRRQHFIDIFA